MHLLKKDYKDIGAAIGLAMEALRKKLNKLELTTGLHMQANIDVFVYVNHDVEGKPDKLLVDHFHYEEIE